MGPCCEDASLEERDTLTHQTKNYRLSPETRDLLEAIRRARPRQFLTFEELFAELVRFYLNYHRTLNGEVERYLREIKEREASADETGPG